MPIHPHYPQQTINYIIHHPKPKPLLTYPTSFQSPLPQIHIQFILHSTQHHIHNPTPINSSQHIPYLIYTSPTTPKPKPTLLPHRPIHRLLHNPNYLQFNQNTTLLLSPTLPFHPPTFQIYPPLLNPPPLLITSKHTFLNPQFLHQPITQNKLNTISLTSSLFNQIPTQP
ncbi:AMP-binding protein, partial [Staphylococcus epidermidis]|uniref:AMP-binding protein n=1 Tax=Staphylococcus epidermidis TaxID=1282 RepID=UPI0028CB1698